MQTQSEHEWLRADASPFARVPIDGWNWNAGESLEHILTVNIVQDEIYEWQDLGRQYAIGVPLPRLTDSYHATT